MPGWGFSSMGNAGGKEAEPEPNVAPATTSENVAPSSVDAREQETARTDVVGGGASSSSSSSPSSAVGSPTGRLVRRARAPPELPAGLKDTVIVFDPRYLFHVTATPHERPERLRR